MQHIVQDLRDCIHIISDFRAADHVHVASDTELPAIIHDRTVYFLFDLFKTAMQHGFISFPDYHHRIGMPVEYSAARDLMEPLGNCFVICHAGVISIT